MKPQQLAHILYEKDIYLTPIYLLLIFILSKLIKIKYLHDNKTRVYFIPALMVKLAGCILLSLIYEFHYGYGDSFNYYTGASEIWEAFKSSPAYAFELIFKPLDACSPKALEFAQHMAYTGFAGSNVLMFKITGVLNLFGLGGYLPTALIFTSIGFIGSWLIFTVFVYRFPKYHFIIAIATLFMPSCILWSGTIMKEPLCILALGLCSWGMHKLLLNHFKISTILAMVSGVIILLALKYYILYVFVAAVALTLVLQLRNLFHSKVFKSIYTYALITFTLVSLFWYLNNDGVIGSIILDFYKKNAEILQTVTTQMNDGEAGSGYSIDNVDDFSAGGVIRIFVLSFNVAVFRPYLWETKNIMMLFTALESLFVLFLFIFLLYKTRIIGFFSFAAKDPVLMFAFFFFLIFAPMVGFISFNFGTLLRYKIPMLPYLYAYLFIMYRSIKDSKQ